MEFESEKLALRTILNDLTHQLAGAHVYTRVIVHVDVDVGTRDMCYDCSTSSLGAYVLRGSANPVFSILL